jgi:hypothetical protein
MKKMGGGMPRKVKLPEADLRAMWMDHKNSELAKHFGVAPSVVSARGHRLGLPPKPRNRYDLAAWRAEIEAARAARDAAEAEEAAQVPVTYCDHVAASGGRYRALNEIAETFGRPYVRVLQDWHRVSA